MKFIQHDLGYLRGGEIVEVTLGYAANVRLMDSSNFNNFRAGRQHRYFGGHANKSPVRLNVPSAGHWYVAVDLGGYAGRIQSSARVLPGRLPAFREVPLSSVPSLVHRRSDDEEPPLDQSDGEYDVFISHASEDQDEIVRPLAHALRERSLEVWYSEFTLRIGDSLRRKIDLGLAKSRFGIVVLSQAFFAKGWTNYELDGLVTRSVTGEQILLPIWHKVSKQEVIEYSPSLADKLARNTATHTVEEIAGEIAEVIQGT
jgi:hypothetical protein